jgi:hypothetical protein
VFIDPDIPPYIKLTDFRHTQELIRLGEEAATLVLNKIKA